MFPASFRVALIALAATATAVHAAPSLSLEVTGPDTVNGVENFAVTTTLTNTGDEILKFLNNPNSVLDVLPTNVFNILHANGASPDFVGVKAKYSPTQAAASTDPSDFTVIAPGQSVSFIHDLLFACNFTDIGYGAYTLDASNLFRIVGSGGVSGVLAAGQPYVATLTGGDLSAIATSLTRRANFNGCSASQQSALNAAAPAAHNYAQGALSYLRSKTASTPRYATWFGNYTDSRHSAVLEHFNKVSTNNFTGFSYDRPCTRNNTYAYAYANKFGTIYLRGAFWPALLTDIDSKAGTRIHEASHFTVNGGTQDYAYG